MSADKKAGSRDISELKQRLGLKKGGAAAAPSGSTPRANGAGSGGVIAPPGLAVQPPPGLAQPQQPAAPPPPNAHEDPFGAMNHMAAVAQQAPKQEFIIVNDGKPVENVGAQSGGASIAKLLIPAGIALVVGIAVGKIGTSASSYNDGLRGAKAILGDKTTPSTVRELKATLNELDQVLDEANTKNGLKPNLEVDKKLKELAAKLEVKTDLVFRAKQSSLDAALSGQILSFYAGVVEVKDMIDAHNKAATYDDIMLKKGKEKADAATAGDGDQIPGMFRYAVVMSAPTDEDKNAPFGAKLVEIAGVYCGTSNTPQAKCADGEGPSGFAYRSEPGATPMKGELVSSGSDNVPTKKAVVLLDNGIRDAFVKSTEPTVSEVYYTRRLKALYDRVHGKVQQDGKAAGGLLDDGNKLETRLGTEANKGSRFSFFM